MNPFTAIKTYLKWKPQIAEAEAAAGDFQKGDVKSAMAKVWDIVEPLLFSVATGAFGASADYAQTVLSGGGLDWPRMETIALAGAAAGFKIYLADPTVAKVHVPLKAFLYAAIGGSVTALSSYAHTLLSGEPVNIARIGVLAAAGAIVGAAVYLKQPRQASAK